LKKRQAERGGSRRSEWGDRSLPKKVTLFTIIFYFSENSIDDKGHFVVHGIITAMGVGRRGRGQGLLGFWKCQQKRVIFLVSSGKKQISPLLDPLEKF